MKANLDTGMKVCTRCKTEKKLVRFSKNKTMPDGLDALCKKCRKVYNDLNVDYRKQWMQENVELDVSIIYAVYRKSDRRIVYLGETLYTLDNRMSKHKTSAFALDSKYPFHQAIREHGIEAFDWIVLTDQYSEDFTEKYFIELLKPVYNKNKGNKKRKVRNECVT